MSQANQEDEKAMLVKLLKLYREYRCLWDTKSEHYANKDSRNVAYRSLLKVYKKCYNEASLTDLKKKVENMRCAYRRELRKIKASERTGSSSNDVYMPRLWYFEYMTFLDEKDYARGGGTDTLEEDEPNEDEDTEATVIPETPSTSLTQRKKARICWIEKKKEQRIDSAQCWASSKEADWEIIGRSLGLQLSQLSDDQQTIANKLMADIIFLGKKEKLTDNSSILLCPPTLYADPSSDPMQLSASRFHVSHYSQPHLISTSPPPSPSLKHQPHFGPLESLSSSSQPPSPSSQPPSPSSQPPSPTYQQPNK